MTIMLLVNCGICLPASRSASIARARSSGVYKSFGTRVVDAGLNSTEPGARGARQAGGRIRIRKGAFRTQFAVAERRRRFEVSGPTNRA